MRLTSAAAGILFGALSLTGHAETLTGVAGVVDGDTIAIDHVKIRLEGIDCPEAGQTCRDAAGAEWACGRAATEMTIRLVDRQQVTCEIRGLDRYGRRLGTCHADGAPGQSVNQALVRAGLARAFARYSGEYLADEAVAREARVGIWAGSHESPWDYRARIKAERARR